MRAAGENIKLVRDNLTINYDDYGPIYAPAVIFIHGFPFNKNMWNLQTEALKNNYRIICYDVRGYGNSESKRDNYSVDVLTDDLIYLMDTLQLKKVFVCGLSMGGYIALNAIEKYPDRFNALVLSDTHCLPDTRETKEERLNVIRNIRERGLLEFAEKSIRRFFASMSFIRKKEEVRAARQMILATSVDSICNTLLSYEQKKETCKRLSEIKVPVLIMVGRQDPIVTPRSAQKMHEKIEGSTLKIIECSGHLPNLENTEEFNLHLRRFIDRVTKKRHLSEPVFDHR